MLKGQEHALSAVPIAAVLAGVVAGVLGRTIVLENGGSTETAAVPAVTTAAMIRTV